MESQVRCLLGIPLGLFGTLGLGAGVLHSIHECPQPGLRKAVAGLKGHEFMVLVLRTIALDHSAARSDLARSRFGPARLGPSTVWCWDGPMSVYRAGPLRHHIRVSRAVGLASFKLLHQLKIWYVKI